MLMASHINFKGKAGVHLFGKANARLYIGDHPKTAPLRELDIDEDPFFTMFIPESNGILDDYFESWFLTYEEAPDAMPEGLESVIDLDLSEEWLDPPSISDYDHFKV
jgi:hypothetical protein